MSTAGSLLCQLLLLTLPGILAAQDPLVAIIEHPLPHIATLLSITFGADGALWFANGEGSIGRITTAGALSGYPVLTRKATPQGITAGPDGALWFTENVFNSGKIGRITTAGVVTEFPVTSTQSAVREITAGADGALWFTEPNSGRIGRISTTGSITEFMVPTPNSRPTGITSGPDGALWFTEIQANQIGRITTAGIVTEYPITGGFGNPNFITAGPDGALWFTEAPSGTGGIGRIDTTGSTTIYPLPITTTGNPYGITTGPDGALWFAEYYGYKIGRITPAGEITEYPVTVGSYPYAITAGSDGNIWFTEFYPSAGNRVGQTVFPSANLLATPATGAIGTRVTFNGNGYSPNEVVNLFTNRTGGTPRTSVVADASGGVDFTSLIHEVPAGGSSVVGVGQTSGRIGVGSITVEPRLTLSPQSGTPGSIITAEGYGFEIETPITIIWNSPKTVLATANSNSLGSFTGKNAVTFGIPTGFPPGTYGIRAQGIFAIAFATITIE